MSEFISEVASYCIENGHPIAWEISGGSHIKIRDRKTMLSILGADGVPLTLPATPSDYRWKQNARAQFRRAGLLPKVERRPASAAEKRTRILTLADRIGRALRPDLKPSTRKALLREIAELVDAASSEEVAA